MKRVREIVLMLISIVIVVTGCQKEEPGMSSSLPSMDEVVLYESHDKSIPGEGMETGWYGITAYGEKGFISLTLDVTGNLVKSTLTREMYDKLRSRYDLSKLQMLPGEVLSESGKLAASGYEYWERSKFIAPMSRDEFDRRMGACEDKRTSTGVLLCAARVIIEAISDCLKASEFDKDIHCW